MCLALPRAGSLRVCFGPPMLPWVEDWFAAAACDRKRPALWNLLCTGVAGAGRQVATQLPFAFQLFHVARKLLGQRMFEGLMKMTFYGHFVAGEDQESIRPLIRHNKAFGVGFILDYGVEEDLSPEEAERKDME